MKIRNVLAVIALSLALSTVAAAKDVPVVYGQGDIVVLKGTTKRFLVHVCTKTECTVRSLDNVEQKHKFAPFEIERAPMERK